jgi:hypothetical protein
MGAFIEDGLDINASYHVPINYNNALTFGADIQDVMAYKTQTQPNQPFVSYLGTDYGPMKWVANGTITYTHGPWALTYMLRYIDGFHYYPNSSYGPGLSLWYKVDPTFYHDLMLTYTGNIYTITGGVKNLGGQDPTFYANGSYNTAPGIYDYSGRYVYLKAQVHF